MSQSSSHRTSKTKSSKPTKRRRFHQATRTERRAKIEPPVVTPKQHLMQQLLPAEVLTCLAQKWNARDERQRKLTCVTFFWLTVLAVGPGGPLSLQKVLTYLLVAQVVAGVGSLQASLSKEAVSENFRERPWQFFAAVVTYLVSVHAQVWSQYVGGVPMLAAIRDVQVLLVDATVIRVARQLVAVFPVSHAKKAVDGAGVKLQVSLDLFRGLPTVLALSPQAKNERKIAFFRPAGEAALYIFDLGYWTYELFDTIITQGQHFISRLRADCNPRILKVYVGKQEWVGKRLKEITLTGQTVDLLVNVSSDNPHNPQMQHNVRLVGLWHAAKHRWHLYLTSLLAWQKFSAVLIGELYRLRWQIEILFRTLKSTLQLQHFIAHTENGIRIQIYAALIHYLLTQIIILKAAYETGYAVEDFSVPYCLEIVQQVLMQTRALVLKGQAVNWDEVERQLVEAVVAKGLRPNRQRQALLTKVKARLRHTAPLPA